MNKLVKGGKLKSLSLAWDERRKTLTYHLLNVKRTHSPMKWDKWGLSGKDTQLINKWRTAGMSDRGEHSFQWFSSPPFYNPQKIWKKPWISLLHWLTIHSLTTIKSVLKLISYFHPFNLTYFYLTVLKRTD